MLLHCEFRYYIIGTATQFPIEDNSLNPEIGKRIARGEDIEILPQNLTQVQAGYRSRFIRCSNCGFETQEEFEFCPKCGRRF